MNPAPNELPRYSVKVKVTIEDGHCSPLVHAQWGSYHTTVPVLTLDALPGAMRRALEHLAREVGQSLVFDQ